MGAVVEGGGDGALQAACEVIVTTDLAFDGLDGLRRVDPLATGAVNILVGR